MTWRPDERDLEQAVRSWLRDEVDHPADRNRQVGRIMGRVDETRQRRAAWRLLPFLPHGPTADDDLVRARAEAPAPLMTAAAVIALIAVSLAFLAVQPSPQPIAPGESPEASASPRAAATIDPADQALAARFRGIWSEPEISLEEVREVYAEDAAHTLLWHDTVERFRGPRDIWQHIGDSATIDPGAWVRVPDAYPSGEHRYLGVSADLEGIACLIWVRDARVTRHDCILPAATTETWPPEFVSASATALESRAELVPTLSGGWARADRELIEQVVSPDIRHHAAYPDRDYTTVGIDGYLSFMGFGEIAVLAPPVALAAPEGEARWAELDSVMGGSLCAFWVREDLVVRHDCVLPYPSLGFTQDEAD